MVSSLCSASAAVVLIEDHNVRRARGKEVGRWDGHSLVARLPTHIRHTCSRKVRIPLDVSR